MSTSFELDTVKNYLVGLQSRITGALTDIDGTPFLVDAWQKSLVKSYRATASPRSWKVALCLSVPVVAFLM